MTVTAVVGGHWGDEGKGRVVDALAGNGDLVIRYNGGSNAGHTIVTERGTFRLHLIPSGIFRTGCAALIGPGVVVNPYVLAQEMTTLRSAGVDLSGLRVSSRAHLVFPHHVIQDELEEEVRGGGGLGTTRQGIWPVYADKAARIGIRVGDLFEPDYLGDALATLARRKGTELAATGGPVPSMEELLDICARWREQLAPFVVDSFEIVAEALRTKRRILLEGHLGVMRDLDWGLYPFVTSSTCLPGGGAAGAGVPAAAISRVVAVVKAYTTVVGAGPFPTELHDETGRRLRDVGQEYGATTGRPRRCGWFDGVAARFAAQVAGFTELAVMKLDVLSGFERVKICVGYRLRGRPIQTMPHTATMAGVEPVYEELPGWTLRKGVRRFGDLPREALGFLGRLEEIVGVPVTLAGVGPARPDLVTRGKAAA